MQKTEDFYKEFSRWINGAYTDDFREFAQLAMRDHRTLQQCTFSLLMTLIQEFAKAHDNGYYDARNEFSCAKAKEILEKIPDMDLRAPFI
jgi:hypothetical protein